MFRPFNVHRLNIIVVLIFGVSLTAAVHAQATNPPLIKRTAEEAKYKVCGDWNKSEKANTFCGFLRDNYSTLQRVCGLAPSKSWIEPWTWLRNLDPIKAVPPQVLSSMHSRVRSQQDQQENEYLLLEDTTSLSRLLTYVSPTPLINDGTKTFKEDVLLHIEGPEGVDQNLQFNPILDPETMLALGSGNVVHMLSCSDVWSAMVNAGISFNPIKAAAKISAEQDTNTTYKLVYGLFESPMEYMRREHPDTFYFETLDWYLRQARTGKPDKAGNATQDSSNQVFNYIKSARGIAIYSALKEQTTSTGNGSVSGGFTSPFFSIDASASDSATSKGELKTQVFHILLGEASDAQLPNIESTAHYLNHSIQANVHSAPVFDKDKHVLKMSIQIEGMPHSLCQRGVWIVTSPVTDIAKGANASQATTVVTGSPDGDTTPELFDVAYHKAGEVINGSTVRTRSQCEFELSGPANATSNFSGVLSPYISAPNATNKSGSSAVTGGEGSSAFTTIQIPFNVPYDPPKPTLQAVDSPTASPTDRDWNFQIVDSSGIDKGMDPDASKVQVQCNEKIVAQTTANATFLSLLNNMRGSYLKIHTTVPAPDKGKSISDCSLSGRVIMTARNGTKVQVEVSPKVPPTNTDPNKQITASMK